MKSILLIYTLVAVVFTSTDIALLLALALFFLVEIYMLLWVFGKVPNPVGWLVKSVQKKYVEWLKI